MPDEDEAGHDGLPNLVEEALFVDTLMGWDGDPKELCGCWNAINTHPGLDLRADPVHGTPGHPRHDGTTHAWCANCSPGSVTVIEEALSPGK